MTLPLAGAVDACPARAPTLRPYADEGSAPRDKAALAGLEWKEVADSRKRVSPALRARQSIVTRTGRDRLRARWSEAEKSDGPGFAGRRQLVSGHQHRLPGFMISL